MIVRNFEWTSYVFMFSGSSRLKLDNMKLHTMLQEVDIDEVSNFFNITI